MSLHGRREPEESFGEIKRLWREDYKAAFVSLLKTRPSGINRLREACANKKAELDRLRGFADGAPGNLEQAHDLELTYAIEVTTLSAAETALVIEHGVTIGGKPLKDHLEAIDHFAALRYVRDLARERVALREADIRDLHRLVVQRSAPEIAGRYADQARFVVTDSGRQSFPSADKVPALMGDFAQWLASALATPETAFAAHRRLLRGGYPPVAVRPQDRPSYIGGVTGFGRKWR